MEDFQQRVVDEKTDLDEKVKRLDGFLVSEAYANLSDDKQKRLARQFTVMTEYSDILGERIAAF